MDEEQSGQVLPPTHLANSWDRLAWASTLGAGAMLLGLLNIVAQAADKDAALSALTYPLAFLGVAIAAGGFSAATHTSIQADLACGNEPGDWKLKSYASAQTLSAFLLALAFAWLLCLHPMGVRLQPAPTAPPAFAASRK